MQCLSCSRKYQNIGELDAHLNRQPICRYGIRNNYNLISKANLDQLEGMEDNKISNYDKYKECKDKLIHIIWNILLVDKTTKITSELIQNNNVGYILAILPNEQIYIENMQEVLNVNHHIIEYGDKHDVEIDEKTLDQYIEQGQIMDNFAKGTRRNVIIFCNNGYQRSLPFICYYLIKFHPDEVPNLDKALDIILPQIDKNLYSEKSKYLENLERLNIFL